MGGKWSILQSLWREQPAPTVRLHDKRVIACDSIHPCSIGRRYIIRALANGKIGDVVAGPLLLLFIPPHILLTLGPRSSLRISRGAIVENTAVSGPGIAPFQIRIVIGHSRCG